MQDIQIVYAVTAGVLATLVAWVAYVVVRAPTAEVHHPPPAPPKAG